MALNIKDEDTERLAQEVANLAGETKTGAVRTALRERRERLLLSAAEPGRTNEITRFLTEELWPQLPDGLRGEPISREERERILGYGESGV